MNIQLFSPGVFRFQNHISSQERTPSQSCSEKLDTDTRQPETCEDKVAQKRSRKVKIFAVSRIYLPQERLLAMQISPGSKTGLG